MKSGLFPSVPPDVYKRQNTGLTQKIFDFFLESAAKKFVFFSSVKAAADSVTGDMLTEDVADVYKRQGFRRHFERTADFDNTIKQYFICTLKEQNQTMLFS